MGSKDKNQEKERGFFFKSKHVSCDKNIYIIVPKNNLFA